MGLDGLRACAAAACLLWYLPAAMLPRAGPRGGLAFTAPVPGAAASPRVLQGPCHGAGQPELPAEGRSPSVLAVVAAAAGLAGCLARGGGVSPQRRPWPRVICLGKKKGGGGKGGKGGGGKAGGGRGGGGRAAPGPAGDEEVEVDTEAIVQDYSQKMGKCIEVLKDSMSGIRAGRATPQLLDGIKVSAYDTQCAIKEVGSISTMDVSTLTVSCFDESLTDTVSSAIISADRGFTVSSFGNNIKVQIPPMTTDKRTQYVKMAKEYTEKSRVAVRNIRQKAMKQVKGLKNNIGEDDSKALTTELEDLVKKCIGDCDKLLKDKEAELMQL